MLNGAKPDSQKRSARLALLALVVLGLVARLALGLMMSAPQARRLPESLEYAAIAGSLARGDGFVLPEAVVPGGRKLAHRMPGYPLVLAAAELVFDRPVRAVLVFQSLCGAGVLVVLLWPARRLAGLWAGVVAVGLMAFDPYQAYLSALAVPIVAMSFSLAIVMAAGVRYLGAVASGEERGWFWAALAGAALADATYFEPWAAGLAVVAGAAALLSRVRKRLLAGWAVGVVVLVVGLAPWLVRNTIQVGQPVLVTDVGRRLLDGAPGGEVPVPPEGTGEVGACGFYLAEASGRIADAPGAWLRLAVGRVARLWSPGAMPAASSGELHWLAGYTSLLPTAALALAGLWALRRRPVAVWLVLPAVYVTLVRIVLPGPAYDRLAAAPGLAVLAGVGVAALLGRPIAPAGATADGPKETL